MARGPGTCRRRALGAAALVALMAAACGGADDTEPSGPRMREVRAAVLRRYPQPAGDLTRLGFEATGASGNYDECTGTGSDFPRPDSPEWRYQAQGRVDTLLSPPDAARALQRAVSRLADAGWVIHDASDGEPAGTETAEVAQLVGTHGQLDLTITVFAGDGRAWAIVHLAGPCLPATPAEDHDYGGYHPDSIEVPR